MTSPEAPYGELVTTTMRVMTWNVWGRFGPWERRAAAIVATIRAVDPDIVLLQETWLDGTGASQVEQLADELGLVGVHAGGELMFDTWGPTNAILSRWPVDAAVTHQLPALHADDWGGLALTCSISGPRRPVLVCNVALDWPPHASASRQHALVHLADVIVARQEGARSPLVIGGDFNAGPDSDEIRMLLGRRAPARPGFVLFDAWEHAVTPGAGETWSRKNPWAAPNLLPDQRIDHLFTGWPRRGGVGSVLGAWLAGVEPHDGVVASDHYAVVADVRY